MDSEHLHWCQCMETEALIGMDNAIRPPFAVFLQILDSLGLGLVFLCSYSSSFIIACALSRGSLLL